MTSYKPIPRGHDENSERIDWEHEAYCVFGDEYCNETFTKPNCKFWVSVQIDRIKLFVKKFIFKNLPLSIYSKIYPPKNGVQS